MLRNARFNPTNLNRCRCRFQTVWAATIATCLVLGFLQRPVMGQDTEVADPPAATAEPVEQKPEAKQTEGSDKAKTPEKKVVLKTLNVDLRGQELSFKAPESWKAKKKLANNFTKHELKIPKAEGDEKDARLTFSVVGGSNETNIARWKTQFKFPAGAAPDKVFSMEKKTVDGYDLTFVQMRGTYMEAAAGGGPFSGGKKTPRENYTMKVVIISPKGADARTQKCFIKLIGSDKTVKKNAKAYAAMVKSMKVQPAVE